MLIPSGSAVFKANIYTTSMDDVFGNVMSDDII